MLVLLNVGVHSGMHLRVVSAKQRSAYALRNAVPIFLSVCALSTVHMRVVSAKQHEAYVVHAFMDLILRFVVLAGYEIDAKVDTSMKHPVARSPATFILVFTAESEHARKCLLWYSNHAKYFHCTTFIASLASIPTSWAKFSLNLTSMQRTQATVKQLYAFSAVCLILSTKGINTQCLCINSSDGDAPHGCSHIG